VFSSDIDNLTFIKEVRNIMIGPVHAHKEPLRAENTKVTFDREKPIGIIQLINKNNKEKINDYDMKKFEQLQHLIGLAIEQCTEQHSVVNIRLGVQDKLNAVKDMIRDQMTLNQEFQHKNGKLLLAYGDGKRECEE